MISTTHAESIAKAHLSEFTNNINASTITMPSINSKQAVQMPATSRGRALYHVEWFLNGHPSKRNYDNTQLTIKDLVYA